MDTTPSSLKPPDTTISPPLAAVLALADHVAGIIGVAEGLLRARRVVRLDGLDQHVGRLCAGALDLPAEQGREARTRLRQLVTDLDRVRQHLTPG